MINRLILIAVVLFIPQIGFAGVPMDTAKAGVDKILKIALEEIKRHCPDYGYMELMASLEANYDVKNIDKAIAKKESQNKYRAIKKVNELTCVDAEIKTPLSNTKAILQNFFNADVEAYIKTLNDTTNENE